MLKHDPNRPTIDTSLFTVEPPLPGEVDKTAVGKAVKILKPKPEELEDCRDDIRCALTSVQNADDQHELFSQPSKETKKKFKKFHDAIKRAKAAQDDLPRLQRLWLEQICRLEAGITFCKHEEERWEGTPTRKPHPPNHKQRRAVSWAYLLVQLWLVQKRNIYEADSVSRKSPWSELSAALFGKEVNLLGHMARHKSLLRGSSETPATPTRASRERGRK